MDRVVVLLLSLLIGLIGADRINLLAGAGAFILTPFLALTPIVVLAEAVRMRGRVVRLPDQVPLYLLVASALLCVVGVSALLSADPVLSGKRTALLVTHVLGSLALAVILLNQDRPKEILVRGAYIGLVLTAVFNVIHVYLWTTGGWNPSRPETELLINMAPRTYGPWLPRLSGTVIDQGRAGLIAVIYLFLIFRFAPSSRVRSVMLGVGIVFLVGTLSRAAILCALTAGGVYWLFERRLRLSGWHVLGGIAVAGSVLVLVVLSRVFPESPLRALEPLSARMTVGEGSSQMHLALIEHGLIVATSSFQNALLGIGYGNGLMVLEDFFPGNRYANFHSYYVTLLAESGIVALALGLWLLVHPFLTRWGPFVPLVAGFMAYNVFYQSTTDPAFWLVVALAWMTAGGRGVGWRSAHDREMATPAGLA